MPSPPDEPADGLQDDEAPDVRLAVVAAIRLLRDVANKLEPGDDLRTRSLALRDALIRLRAELELEP